MVFGKGREHREDDGRRKGEEEGDQLGGVGEPFAGAHQRCDERANGIVSREHKEFRPDRTIAYAYSDPTVRDASAQSGMWSTREGRGAEASIVAIRR